MTCRCWLVALDLPLRSLELEFGPSQLEVTFAARPGSTPPTPWCSLRSAVKQICRARLPRRRSCRGRDLPNIASSGWHLHRRSRSATAEENAFAAGPDDYSLLSKLGQGYLAGLLEHAPAATAFSTPTINGYKRFNPNSLAPDRIAWGVDNRAR